MNRSRFFVLLAVVSMALAAGFAYVQDASRIDAPRLKKMLGELGYKVDDIETEVGKEKYAVVVVRDGLDIPVGVELSGNRNYLWMTVNLGKAPEATSKMHSDMLRENAKRQPTHFYISGRDLVMLGLPTENRGVDNALLRQRLDSIADTVIATEELWKDLADGS
jgi:hypothetical protein